MSRMMDGGDRVDMRVFTLSVLLLAGVVGPLLLFPESSTAMISSAFSFTTGKFGWLYMLAGLATVVFLVGLAFSRYGNVRLGGP
jgi:BCCT family betaine/carnitine transporter